jgi:hypothetical protein
MHDLEKSSEFKSRKYGGQSTKNKKFRQQPLGGFSGAGQR